MLVSIGKRAEPADLVELLLDCHERIRRFVALARGVSASGADAEAADVVAACGRIERYFTEALPLHVRDEEESILPRLRGHSHEVDAALESMRAQHGGHAAPLRALLAACTSLREAPGDAARKATLGVVAAELDREFGEHLKLEESVLFPAIRGVLSAAAQTEIVAELRARRS